MFANSDCYSNEELFRVNGTLPANRIEALLECEDKANALENVEAHISEAKGCFVSEDCLHEIIDYMQQLAKHMRGENRTELLRIIECAESLQSELGREGEYGADELRQALKIINMA